MTAHKATGTAFGFTTTNMTIVPSMTDASKGVVTFIRGTPTTLDMKAAIVNATTVAVTNNNGDVTNVVVYMLQT